MPEEIGKTKELKPELDRQAVLGVIREYMQSEAFTDRKVTDNPTDALSVVNRKYVTLNGTTANRPTGSVTGQMYLDTTIGRPVFWNGSTFIDAAGSVS